MSNHNLCFDRQLTKIAKIAIQLSSNEPRHKKTNILHMRKQRRRSALGNHEADQRLCFRYIDSTIPLLSKSEISSLWPSSVDVQPGLCRTRSETRTLVFS